MVTMTEIHGKRVAVVAWAKKANGDDDVAVFSGIADWDGERLLLVRDPVGTSFAIPNEWFDRIKRVPDELRATLMDSEYFVSVTVGEATASELSTLDKTGLHWPKDNNSPR